MAEDNSRWRQVEDAGQFARVWKRVEPGEGGLVTPKGEAAAPAPPEPYPLGEDSGGYGELLCAAIREEVADWRAYRALAAREGSRVLGELGAQELSHAKRLSAAYFLISGVRYLPLDEGRGPLPPREEALRARFQAEQRGERRYLAAAEETADPALAQLFTELGREESIHAQRVRRLLEG